MLLAPAGHPSPDSRLRGLLTDNFVPGCSFLELCALVDGRGSSITAARHGAQKKPPDPRGGRAAVRCYAYARR